MEQQLFIYTGPQITIKRGSRMLVTYLFKLSFKSTSDMIRICDVFGAKT